MSLCHGTLSGLKTCFQDPLGVTGDWWDGAQTKYKKISLAKTKKETPSINCHKRCFSKIKLMKKRENTCQQSTNESQHLPSRQTLPHTACISQQLQRKYEQRKSECSPERSLIDELIDLESEDQNSFSIQEYRQEDHLRFTLFSSTQTTTEAELEEKKKESTSYRTQKL